MRLVLFCLVFLALSGCREDAAGNQTQDLSSPEAVLHRYQAHVDSNRFEAAARLSTPAEQERLRMLAAILKGENPDSTIMHTRFIDLQCEEKADTAWCRTLLEDEYERYEQTFLLVRQNGQWRVDAPEEEILIEDEVIEDMLDSLTR